MAKFSCQFSLLLSLCCLLFLTTTFISCKDEEESKAPVITSFSPTKGLPGTVVTINGKNFNANVANNTVKFSNTVATVTAASQTTLTVTVPDNVVTGKIEVITNNQSALSSTEFIVPPVITDFSPKSGIAGTDVTISGTGFSSTLANNQVRFNGVDAMVSAATPTSLVAKAPLAGSTGTITVQVGGEISSSVETFNYIPVINGFAPTLGAVNTVVTINGSGFALPAVNNIIKVNGVDAEVLSGDANTLVIKVPESATTGPISVTSDGTVLTTSSSFEVVVEAWMAGGPAFDTGYSIAVDASGNSYVTGSFQGSAYFENTPLSGGDEEIFVAKYDSEGELLWVTPAGGTSNDRGNSIVLDDAGNSYITGNFSNTAQFGPFSKTSSGSSDVFVTKLNASGDFQWVISFGSTGTEIGDAIIVDTDDNLVVTGSFSNTINTGATNLTSGGGLSIFVAKFNKDTGNEIWAKSYGGQGDDYGNAITSNEGGDLYIGGAFSGVIQLGTNTLTAGGSGFNSFIAKLDNLGGVLWAKQIIGSEWNNAFDMTVDEVGNCVVAGYFTNTATVGTTVLNATANEEIYLAKYTSLDGSVVWAKKAGGSGYDVAWGVTQDANDNIYVVGYFEGEVTFGDISVQATTNDRNIFVAKYDSNGSPVWVKTAGGSDSDFGYDVALGNTGIVHLTGAYRYYTSTFGVTPLESEGNDDIFIWRIWP